MFISTRARLLQRSLDRRRRGGPRAASNEEKERDSETNETLSDDPGALKCTRIRVTHRSYEPVTGESCERKEETGCCPEVKSLLFSHVGSVCRSNAVVQLQAHYHHCGVAASEKCLSAATFVRWRSRDGWNHSTTRNMLETSSESGSGSPKRLRAPGGGLRGYHFR